VPVHTAICWRNANAESKKDVLLIKVDSSRYGKKSTLLNGQGRKRYKKKAKQRKLLNKPNGARNIAKPFGLK
jgi:hypothetical protein